MSNPVPEKLVNFRVYLDGADMLGVADVQLPSIEPMTETVKGAGIAGEVESPVLGHVGSLTLTLNWRTVTGDMTKLAKQMAHSLDLRGSTQIYDGSAGQYRTVPVRVVVRAIPKKVDLGKLDVGTTADASNDFECPYLKVWYDSKEKIEIDKYNYIFKVDGTDYLATVRADLGI